VTIEEHVLSGGFGSAVAELLASRRSSMPAVLERIAIPDLFVDHGDQAELRDAYGLTPSAIVRTVLRAFPSLAYARAQS